MKNLRAESQAKLRDPIDIILILWISLVFSFKSFALNNLAFFWKEGTCFFPTKFFHVNFLLLIVIAWVFRDFAFVRNHR